MSASLVGSEMCIRDSSGGATSSSAPREVLGSVGSASVEVGSVDRFGPVSYTHLTLPTICSV
eukprot:14002301-Alexandrium_andersonii.AAC.1